MDPLKAARDEGFVVPDGEQGEVCEILRILFLVCEQQLFAGNVASKLRTSQPFSSGVRVMVQTLVGRSNTLRQRGGRTPVADVVPNQGTPGNAIVRERRAPPAGSASIR